MRTRHTLVRSLAGLGVITLALTPTAVGQEAPRTVAPAAAQAATAAAPLTVAQAISTQNGSTAQVRGYIVGQPTATSTVIRSSIS